MGRLHIIGQYVSPKVGGRDRGDSQVICNEGDEQADVQLGNALKPQRDWQPGRRVDQALPLSQLVR